MPEQHLLVDFDCDDSDVTVYVWLAFWDSTRPWLVDRGYTLFKYGYHWGDRHVGEVTCSIPKLNDASPCEVEHTFSKYGCDAEGMPVPTLSASVMVRPFILHVASTLIFVKRRVAFAQDSLQHHVALKLTKKSSHEYKIAQLLSKESSLRSLEGFAGVLPPLDLLDVGDHCIVVMPRFSILSALWSIVCS